MRIITLTTDFGLGDFYVAAMKAAVLRRCRSATLVDITHLVPPQDVLSGSIALERAVASFPAGTVHLAVVDPGVGTSRRILVARANASLIICPDNGLITWTHRRHGVRAAYELLWRPAASSCTFHGRDIMAPAAAMLAAGTPPRQIARHIDDPLLLDIAPAPAGATTGKIIHIDHYGNASSNLLAEHVPATVQRVLATGRDVGPIRQTYRDVPRGSALALINSSGLLEIAVRDGSAAVVLGLRTGDEVVLRCWQ